MDDTIYICAFCGEEIQAVVDIASGGMEQSYTEDCPVCCRPNLLRVTVFDDGEIHIRAEAEYR